MTRQQLLGRQSRPDSVAAVIWAAPALVGFNIACWFLVLLDPEANEYLRSRYSRPQ